MTQKQKFRQAFELVRRNTTAKQRRHNALYNRKIHSPTNREDDFAFLYYHVTVFGQSSKPSSPWRGPYRIWSVSMTLFTKLRNSPLADSKLLNLIASNDTMELRLPQSPYRHDSQLLDLLSRQHRSPPRWPSTMMTVLSRSYLLLLFSLLRRGSVIRFRPLQTSTPPPECQRWFPCNTARFTE